MKKSKAKTDFVDCLQACHICDTGMLLSVTQRENGDLSYDKILKKP